MSKKSKPRKIKYKKQFCKRKLKVNPFGKIDYKDAVLLDFQKDNSTTSKELSDKYLTLNNYLVDPLEDLKSDYIAAINNIKNIDQKEQLSKELQLFGYYRFKINFLSNLIKDK